MTAPAEGWRLEERGPDQRGRLVSCPGGAAEVVSVRDWVSAAR